MSNKLIDINGLQTYHQGIKSKLVPTGGHENLILTWKQDGEAKWDNLGSIFGVLEEILAYGVEWDTNVADPHLTRIGNMTLHKTLPILSLLKGCIALGDKIMYWLDENDWRFRADHPKTTKITLDSSATFENNIISIPNESDISAPLRDDYHIHFDQESNYIPDFYVKINGVVCKVIENTSEYITGLVVDFTFKALVLEDNFELTDTIEVEFGSRLDGYDGTVRVYCPEFYIKSQIIGTKRRVWLSTVKISDSWILSPEILVDAYRTTVLNQVPLEFGYLTALPINSAISVVNTDKCCRGGNNNDSYDKYLTGADDTPIDIFRTLLGKPRTLLSRSTMRTYARNANSELLSYELYKNIFYWLYVVEYANFNCLEAYNPELTLEGYHQGGLGTSITNMLHWGEYNGYNPITPCGYGNKLGNKTGLVSLTIPEFVLADKTIPAQTMYMSRWRGFDNPFGDIWTNLDGIIIDADADNHPNNMNYVYTCQDPAKYADSLNDSYEKVGEEVHQDGYTKLFDLGDSAHIIPNVMGGNTTQYKCDYHWTGNKNTTLRTLLVGGSAADSTSAGLGHFYSVSGVSGSSARVGFRSVSSFLSFLESA